MNDIGIRRLIQVMLVLAVLFGVAGMRLAWLQFGIGRAQATEATVSKQAVSQRTDGLTVDSGRGQFLDRHGDLLTGIPVKSLAAFPDYGMPRGSQQAMERVAVTLGTSSDSLDRWLRELKEPQVWSRSGSPLAMGLTDGQIRDVVESGLLGISVLPYRNRYSEVLSSLHAIGYVSQDPGRLVREYPRKLAEHRLPSSAGIGGAGLEKSLDRLLQGVGPTVVNQVTDARRLPLQGLGLRTVAPDNPHFPVRVQTTLDMEIQRETAEAMLAAGARQGAAVVLNAENADILAMISLPRLDPYNIRSAGTDERNHAITAYPPGSVFKTVTLAAALEAGDANLGERFRCDGEYDRYGLKCWREGGHGVLTLEQAFAQSCNVIFASLADQMDPAWTQITAERLGLGRQVGWFADSFVDGQPLRLLGEEEPGVVFKDKKTAQDGGVRTGTGIGQRDVRVTPLQAANMVVTLLHGGKVKAPRLVTEIRYSDGGLMAKLPTQASPSKYGEIRPQTAAAVLQSMRTVVTDGTAHQALASSVWPLAGKSGTAELAGKQKTRNDHWFVGYGPAENHPRYAVAILIENQPAGLRNRAAAVFGDVMKRLRLLEEPNHQAPRAAVSEGIR
ncbi:MAG: penicillin-binding protein [Cohnella sp.]|nr:penicillin-binding protein [Cohnella sp.]